MTSMISPKEAADMLGVSHSTIRRAYKNGTLDPKIRAVMVGHRLRINRHDIETLIKEQ